MRNSERVSQKRMEAKEYNRRLFLKGIAAQALMVALVGATATGVFQESMKDNESNKTIYPKTKNALRYMKAKQQIEEMELE